jgi:predicted secreted protein
VKVFSTDEKGQVLQVKPEQGFLLVLPDPSAGGYMAQKIPEFDTEILVFEKIEQKPPGESNRRGNFGSIAWHFRARKEGISTLTIRASRAWENDQAPIILFEATVQVAQ